MCSEILPFGLIRKSSYLHFAQKKTLLSVSNMRFEKGYNLKGLSLISPS